MISATDYRESALRRAGRATTRNVEAGVYGLIWLLVGVPTSLWFQAHVIVVLWRWFVAPAGYKPISLATAFGANLIFAVLQSHPTYDEEEALEPPKKFVRWIGRGLLAPLILLFVGWIAHMLWR